MISAKDFGAVGDGVTDDTKALQEWGKSREDRFVPEGVYIISEPIFIARGGRVFANLGDVIIKCAKDSGLNHCFYNDEDPDKGWLDITGFRFVSGTDKPFDKISNIA